MTWTCQTEPPPPEISLIAGDAIHNLRSSLDLMMSSVMLVRTGKAGGAKFPFAEDMDQLTKILHGSHDKAGHDVGFLIRSFRPVKKDGNIILRALHELDIVDKHRIILSSSLLSNSGCLHIRFLDGREITLGDQIDFVADNLGKIKILSIRGDDAGRIISWRPSRPFVVFSNTMPLAFQRIDKSIDILRALTSDIIDSFEAVVS